MCQINYIQSILNFFQDILCIQTNFFASIVGMNPELPSVGKVDFLNIYNICYPNISLFIQNYFFYQFRLGILKIRVDETKFFN